MRKHLVLCFLGLIGLLLAAHHSALAPARTSPQAVAQANSGVAQAASDDAGPSLLFADDFERGTTNWRFDETGSWEVRTENGNQALHGVAFATANPDTAWDDYQVFETRVRVANSASEAKIAFRVGQQAAGYYLGLGGDGVLRLDKWDGADWTHLGSDPGPYPPEGWYLLALAGEGSQLRAYVDGELAIEASDAAYASGSLMLNVPFGEADFDDVWVAGDAPAACPVIPANGLSNPFGIAFNAQGELFVTDGGELNRVTDEQEAVFFAVVGDPGDLAIDQGGNFYVTAPNGRIIYKITPDGTRTDFVTFADVPYNLAMGPDGYLYVGVEADIMRVNPDDGSASLWMAGVAGAMAFDDAGNLYTQGDETTRKITPDKVVSVVTVLPTVRPQRQYTGIAVDEAGNLYVGEALRQQASETDPPWVPPVVADKVYQITPGGQVSTFATGLGGVWDLAFGPDGYLYVTEHDFSGVSKIAPDGTVTPVVPCNGLAAVAEAKYGPDGSLYWVSSEAFTVARLDPQGQIEVVGTGFNAFGCSESRGPVLAFNASGELFVAEPDYVFASRITKIIGGAATVFTHDVDCPDGLAFDEQTGDLYASEGRLGNVVRFTPDGTRHPFVSGLSSPIDLAFGPYGLLYVSEMDGDRVSQIDAGGTVTPFVTLPRPAPLMFLGQDLLVGSDNLTSDIWRVGPSGTRTRFTCDLCFAGGLTLDPDGNSVAACWGGEKTNSIYRFTEGGTTPGVAVEAPGVGLGQPGQVVTHTFTVRNIGNGRDGFWLVAESEHGWPVKVQGGEFVGPVECGLNRSVRVAVTVPAGTDRGVRDTLTLTATSRLSPDVSASTQATTVSGYRVYLPLILKDAG
jgi:sugar lactone lactonase YvrE